MGARQRAKARREMIAALDEVEVAQRVLREQLRAYQSQLRRTRRYFERGGTAIGLRDLMDITEARLANDDALRSLESARTRSHYALYRLAAADGMTATEIGRVWGVSRQLVSRVLNHPGRR
jgi:DNA invertase Pin-like site-specific DNA recombinase